MKKRKQVKGRKTFSVDLSKRKVLIKRLEKVCTLDMRFLPMCIEEFDMQIPTQDEVLERIKRCYKDKSIRKYKVFAAVPVERYTLVIRVDYKDGEPYSAFECARSSKVNGVRSYVVSQPFKNRVKEFLLRKQA